MIAGGLALPAQRCGLHRGQTLPALSGLEAMPIHFLRHGRPVRLNGIGIFTPTVGMDGRKRIRWSALFRWTRRRYQPRRETFPGYGKSRLK